MSKKITTKIAAMSLAGMMAATASLPLAASAQTWSGRGDWDGGGWRRDWGGDSWRGGHRDWHRDSFRHRRFFHRDRGFFDRGGLFGRRDDDILLWLLLTR